MPFVNGEYVQPTRTEVKRVEEWLGEIPADYDYARDVNESGKYLNESREKVLAESLERLRFIEKNKSNCFATDDGGWPRIWHKVLAVGYASQWPHWKPRPVVSVESTYGAKWIDWLMLTDASLPEQAK